MSLLAQYINLEDGTFSAIEDSNTVLQDSGIYTVAAFPRLTFMFRAPRIPRNVSSSKNISFLL